MTKKQEFINFIEMTIEAYPQEMPDNVKMYWDAFRGQDEIEKPIFSEKGKIIIKYLQEHQDIPMWKARDIAEGLFIAPRGVSGAMRKLVDDGFVEKVGQDPVVYALTEKGKNIVIED